MKTQEEWKYHLRSQILELLPELIWCYLLIERQKPCKPRKSASAPLCCMFFGALQFCKAFLLHWHLNDIITTSVRLSSIIRTFISKLQDLLPHLLSKNDVNSGCEMKVLLKYAHVHQNSKVLLLKLTWEVWNPTLKPFGVWLYQSWILIVIMKG